MTTKSKAKRGKKEEDRNVYFRVKNKWTNDVAAAIVYWEGLSTRVDRDWETN